MFDNAFVTTSETNGRLWKLWVIGAAIPIGCAGLALYWFRQRGRARATQDSYEQWWQARERARANGTRPEAPSGRSEGSPLFV